MSETKRTQRMKRIRALTESALMIALATALSFVVLWEMPMGGSVTLASMLPVMLIGIKYGSVQGMGTAFVFSGIQLAQAIAKGNVFIYTETAPLAVAVALLDYVLPYTVIGLAGIFRNFRPEKCPRLGCYLGMLFVVFARFVCHFFFGRSHLGTVGGGYAPHRLFHSLQRRLPSSRSRDRLPRCRLSPRDPRNAKGS